MKTLKKMAHGLIAVAALFLATGCPQPNVTPAEVVEKVTFDPAPESGEISPTDKISLYCETDGVDIYYSVGEELTSENYAEVGTAYNGSFTISEDAIVYAIAVSEKGTLLCVKGSAK